MGRQRRRRRLCLWMSVLNCYGKSIGGKLREEDDGNAEVALQLCQLPKDVIFHILMKIPSKYILKLRCVCKAWYALISDSTFTNSFLGGPPLRDDNNSYTFFIYCQDYGNYGYYPITLSTFHLDHHNRHKTNLLNRTKKSDCSVFLLPYSVNGLVCLVGDKYFYICNPTTEQFRTFPIRNTVVSNFGFGYDKSKNVYKLVQVYREGKIDWLSSYNSIRFAVLTISGTSTISAWKPIKAPECTIEGGWPPILIFVNGAMYMFSNKTVRVHCLGVLKFDIQEEKFESLNLPLEIENAYLDYISMVEMQGKLFMVELQGRVCIVNKIFDHEILRRMDLWILKDPANHDWILRRIVMDSDRGESFRMLIQPLCIIHERKIVFNTASGLVSYDTENKELETLYSDETKAYHFSCTTYVPSLVSLNMSSAYFHLQTFC